MKISYQQILILSKLKSGTFRARDFKYYASSNIYTSLKRLLQYGLISRTKNKYSITQKGIMVLNKYR